MKAILMTTSAVLLVTGFAAGQAQAACPEDIDAFNRQYEQTLQSAAAGEALSTTEQAQLFGLRTAAENLHNAGNAEMCAEVIQRANVILESAIAPQVIRPDELIGREVTNAAEENLGEIEDVMLDPVSGRIAYVVVEHGGILGIGDDLFAVPWRAIQFVPGNDKTLLLEVPEEKLENAPRFSRDDETPLERREWVTSVHNYYGVQPYWQDEVGAMAMQYGGGAMPAAAGTATGGQAQTGEQTSGEVKTIIVPITQSGSEQQSQPETQPETQAEPAGSQTEQQPSDAGGQSAAEPPAGAASLAATQPAEGGAESASADVQALTARMDQLEQQVRTISEKMPGEEMTQAIARLEERIAALDTTGGQSPERQQAPAVVVVPEQGGASGGQQQAAQPSQSAAPASSGGQQEGQASQTPAEQQGQGDAPPAGQQERAGQAPDEREGQASEPPAGQQGQSGDQAVAAQGATTEPTPPATEEAAGQPCEEQIAQLEADLGRAEQQGVAIEKARSELEEAEAMLNNNSEALCRAAVKRAHEELVTVGFEPTQTN